MRIITLLNLLLLLCGAALTAQSAGEANDEQLVRECFAGYKSAILKDKGLKAVEYVDSQTLKYYQDMLDKAKSADSVEVNGMNIMDKLMVFSVRHRTSRKDILKFDGKELLVYSIKEGMVGKNSVENNKIGRVEVEGDFAKGQLVTNGSAVPMYFHFYKEQGYWKIDLTSIFPIAMDVFQKMSDESGLDENEYLLLLLELTTGEKPTAKIWETILEE